MRITNSGRGIHQREIAGIDRLRELPNDWYAFTNLELATGQGQSREVDVIMVIADRILLVDLKDWYGSIASVDGRWTQNGQDRGASPVEKVRANARKFATTLQNWLDESARRNGRRGERVRAPYLQGWVLLTGRANLDGLAANERTAVLYLDQFMRNVSKTADRIELLGKVPPLDGEHSLTGGDGHWSQLLGQFFNVRAGPFRPRQRAYGGFLASSDDSAFSHPGGIYEEYDSEHVSEGRTPGLLRIWDFSKADTRYQTEEARSEVAGRERMAIGFLNDRNPEFESSLLQPRDSDLTFGPSYWEVFERRRRLVRLDQAAKRDVAELPDSMRLDLAQSLLAKAKLMHDLGAAHLDLGGHSIWVEEPSTVRLSHLFAASYPSLASLGEHRFRFLSAGARLPEDCFDEVSDAFRRDVYLLGAAVHQLLMGMRPQSTDAEYPAAWDPSVDAEHRFQPLHDWFEKALNWSPDQRFESAGAMLAAFNEALSVRPSGREILSGLDRFRVWTGQFDLYQSLPPKRTVKQTDRVIVYVSERDGAEVVVKIWRRAAWGDDRQEAPRILAFLERAEDLAQTPLPGVGQILEAGFLGDAIVAVQEFVNGPSLDESLVVDEAPWSDPASTLPFVRRLAAIVNELHGAGVFHGDLKPSNVMVATKDAGLEPVIIDVLDFGPASEGEILTTAYAPAGGGSRPDRDRFAVTRMAEEMLAGCSLPIETATALAKAIVNCRTGPPANATLLPLIEAIDAALAPPLSARPTYAVTMVGEKSRPLLPDEGRYGVRVLSRYKPHAVIVRGAVEELELKVSDAGQFVAARCRSIDQGHIGRVARHEVLQIEADIGIHAGPVASLGDLDFLLNEKEVAAALSEAKEEAPPEADDPIATDLDDDAAMDAVVEAAAASPPTVSFDLPKLWRTLMDVEQELLTEGVVAGESTYRADRKRHVASFELERGTFDFTRHDRVLVERPRRKGGEWMEVGLLDVELSTPTTIAFEAINRGVANTSSSLLQDGERLRFKSHMETQSQSRRETATSRILGRNSVIPGLVDVFDRRASVACATRPVEVDREDLAGAYGLNATQSSAFVDLLAIRPLGLLQGPPGTGKTKFIGSFVHHVLTRGLVRNVLLASQSHEAVNTAAEAVLRLFRHGGLEPSLVRVGQEGSVSEELRPFQAERVETRFKDGFKAELKERLSTVGARLGLEPGLADAVIAAETTLLPVVDRLRAVMAADPHALERTADLARTAETIAHRLGLPSFGAAEWRGDDAYQEFVSELARRHGASGEQVSRLRMVAKLARDWAGSVSTPQRSFETFLAGTRNIVVGTCVGLGRSSLGLTDTRFDLAIIDEAARCTASELAVPMQAARWIILVGDHRQLEPHHRPDVVANVQARTQVPQREILRSDFDRVFSSDYGRAAGRTLTTQYRMLEPIGEVVSKAFYEGRLSHGRSTVIVPPSVLPDEFDKPLTWIETDRLGPEAYQKRTDGHSLVNEAEADAIVALLRRLDGSDTFRGWLATQASHQRPVGIICTYSAQRDLVKRRLVASGLDTLVRDACKVDTVDSYQGKENPMVILSLVRNNADGLAQNGAPTIQPGFMRRPNRINVAVSRAMDRLIIVGARRRWQAGTPLAAVVEAFDGEVARGRARVLSAKDAATGTVEPRGSGDESRAKA